MNKGTIKDQRTLKSIPYHPHLLSINLARGCVLARLITGGISSAIAFTSCPGPDFKHTKQGMHLSRQSSPLIEMFRFNALSWTELGVLIYRSVRFVSNVCLDELFHTFIPRSPLSPSFSSGFVFSLSRSGVIRVRLFARARPRLADLIVFSARVGARFRVCSYPGQSQRSHSQDPVPGFMMRDLRCLDA